MLINLSFFLNGKKFDEQERHRKAMTILYMINNTFSQKLKINGIWQRSIFAIQLLCSQFNYIQSNIMWFNSTFRVAMLIKSNNIYTRMSFPGTFLGIFSVSHIQSRYGRSIKSISKAVWPLDFVWPRDNATKKTLPCQISAEVSSRMISPYIT